MQTLLFIVAQQIANTDKPTLLALMLTCKSLYSRILPLLYESATEKVACWTRPEYIRHLVFSLSNSELLLGDLAILVQLAVNLDSLRIEGDSLSVNQLLWIMHDCNARLSKIELHETAPIDFDVLFLNRNIKQVVAANCCLVDAFVIPPLLESNVARVSMHNIRSSNSFAPDMLAGSNSLITHLDFSGSPALLDATILIILDKLVALESINLAGCMNISDLSSMKIAGIPTIKSIDLSYTNISSISCYALAGVAHPCVKINLHHCVEVTTDAVLHLVKRCTGLVRLGLDGIPDIQRMILILINLRKLSGVLLRRGVERGRGFMCIVQW
jgi:hypothetical protein